MKFLSMAVALALAPVSSVALAQAPEMPGWMAGCWQSRDGERWSEECWTIPRGGQMLGSGRSGDASGVGSFEFMRIERSDEGLVFHGGPGGQGWTAFRAIADAGGGVTFINPEHDYPQRVRYWREGDLLKAEISLADGSRAVEFSFSRMGG